METSKRIEILCGELDLEIRDFSLLTLLTNYRPIIGAKLTAEEALRTVIDLELANNKSVDRFVWASRLLKMFIILYALTLNKSITPASISQVIVKVRDLLIEKNKAYGDSALKPVRIFADAPAQRLIEVRMDDKISRVVHNPTAFGEDVILDLIGYLMLYILSLTVEAQS